MKKPWDMLRPNLGPTSEAMGYLDLLRDLTQMLCMYVSRSALLCIAVSPDLWEARLVRGSVRVSPASEPCTTSLHYAGPYAVERYTYT